MLTEYALNIPAELAYAKKWAYARNPAYYSFDGIGGDCTNFISQCLHAGGAVMNYTKDTGWYYSSANNRAAAWTSVAYFYKFITTNKGVGPYGIVTDLQHIKVGDVIQLGKGGSFYHSLLVINLWNGIPYIATHTIDAYDLPLSAYSFEEDRCNHIIGARKYE